jgi:hypothetical protein
MFTFNTVRLAALGVLPASLLMVGAVANAATGTVADNYPAPVAQWLQQAQQDCPAGFQAHNPIQSVSLTGDGRPGYIADPHRLTCAGEPHLFIGDGPSSIELFVTLPTGEVVHTGGVLALSYQVMQSPQGGAPTLVFQTHGASERTGSMDSYRWDGRNFAVLEQRSLAVPPAGNY